MNCQKKKKKEKMKHSKYTSIENHYSQYVKKIDDLLGEEKKKTQQFVCTEKIHGSNMQFYIQPGKEQGGYDIDVGKRNSMIKKGGCFFPKAVLDVRKKVEPYVIQLFEYLNKKISNLKRVVLYGELFGGKYPGFKEEKGKKKRKPIQKHIFYCPQFNFYSFDVKVIVENEKTKQDQEEWLSFLDFEKCMKHIKMPIYSLAMFKGTLEDCLNEPLFFKTTIPKLLGLDPVKKGNLAEGMVVKPYDTVLYESLKRVMIKRKNKDFIEVDAKKKKRKKKQDLPEEVTKVWDDLERYITKNRLDNVISKIGEVTRKDTRKMIQLLSNDALEEFEIHFPGWKKKVEKKNMRMIKKKISTKCVCLVNAFFKM